MFFDYEAFEKFATEAVLHYEQSAPTVSRYVDDLYIRVSQAQPVQLEEILAVQVLREDGEWMHPNYAANAIYKLMDRMGMDTTGHAGF